MHDDTFKVFGQMSAAESLWPAEVMPAEAFHAGAPDRNSLDFLCGDTADAAKQKFPLSFPE